MQDKSSTYGIITLLGDEQAWTPIICLKGFDMDSGQVGKAEFVKESFTTLGNEPRTYSYLGRLVTILVSVGLKNFTVCESFTFLSGPPKGGYNKFIGCIKTPP